MNRALTDIRLFTHTLELEIEAFKETRTGHDRERARKALSHLEKMIASLRQEVEDATIVLDK